MAILHYIILKFCPYEIPNNLKIDLSRARPPSKWIIRRDLLSEKLGRQLKWIPQSIPQQSRIRKYIINYFLQIGTIEKGQQFHPRGEIYLQHGPQAESLRNEKKIKIAFPQFSKASCDHPQKHHKSPEIHQTQINWDHSLLNVACFHKVDPLQQKIPLCIVWSLRKQRWKWVFK